MTILHKSKMSLPSSYLAQDQPKHWKDNFLIQNENGIATLDILSSLCGAAFADPMLRHCKHNIIPQTIQYTEWLNDMAFYKKVSFFNRNSAHHKRKHVFLRDDCKT